jgi:queuine tRNA-ribosyltransferase
MPVGTNATVKALDPDDLRAAGASIILANTYHLYLRAGPRADRPARWTAPVHRPGDRPILTDSGGFPGRLARRPAGHRRGGGDVPQPPRRVAPPPSRRSTRSRSRRRSGRTVARSRSTSRSRRPRRGAVVADATERTHRWGRAVAQRPLAAPTRRCFGIVQAGSSPTSGPRAPGSSRPLPFDGICLGGLAGRRDARRSASDARRPRSRLLGRRPAGRAT